MEDIMKFLGGLFLITVLIMFIAVISGTLVWCIWPVAIPAAFPGLVASGTLAASLTWWQSVCLSWLAGCLIKSSLHSNKSSK